MKLIEQLNGTVAEGDFTTSRGVLTALHIQDEQCAGWFIELSLSPDGIQLKAKRPDGQRAAITTAAMLQLFREHAPEVFADAETKRATEAAAAAARQLAAEQSAKNKRL